MADELYTLLVCFCCVGAVNCCAVIGYAWPYCFCAIFCASFLEYRGRKSRPRKWRDHLFFFLE